MATITIDTTALLDSALVGIGAGISLTLFFSVAVLAADRARAANASVQTSGAALIWGAVAAVGVALTLAIAAAGIWAMTQK